MATTTIGGVTVNNLGRLQNFISGITGVSQGGVATLNQSVNLRMHRLNLLTLGIAYQNPTVTATPGAGVVVTPTINGKGQITNLAVSGTLIGYTTGAGTLIIVDPNGLGTGASGTINFTSATAATATVTGLGSNYSAQTYVVAYGPAASTPAVLTPTITNGVITNLAITSGGAGYQATASSNTITILDSLYNSVSGYAVRVGQGAAAVVTTVGTGAITALNLTSGGAQSPTPPELVITGVKQLVNGVNMRDITPFEILRIALANRFTYGTNGFSVGQLPVFYTEPWRDIVVHDEITSWDLFGQNTLQYIFNMASNVTNPNITGSYEFDAERNVRPGVNSTGKPAMLPFLNPVRQHQYTYPVPSGRYDLTILPFNFPMTRLWFYGTNSNTGARLGKGSIFQLEVYQDGNKILEQTCGAGSQNDEALAENGFNPNVYDAAFIADIDQRIQKALKVIRNFTVRVYSTQSMTLNVVQEVLPGAYQ